ncbi:nucleotidyl transferase AbiEii/AbiGii toxin family protein [Pseudanabaena sp. PCC 6802]|uniref:nucleotidyl transferase AbiEii/AbiGii toxin family protein n=1 Tax=Pseudanabaena sp. PCC 6802 TaxID=118173 RepID=UPI00034A081D|nr:nucleotidyl transferase AbiEii/AbiGii toxin family protein [Pseudanabaena sp. PCC 6802]
MFSAEVLTFHEFAMQEPVSLATLQKAVLEFLRDRNDVVLFGAQAVNAYVGEPRMTQDIDLLSTHARELAQELKDCLSQEFHIAVRVREIGDGKGYRLFQLQKSGNRHLVDLRPVQTLPAARCIDRIWVMAPPELLASKAIAFHQRRGQPKSGTDWRDIAMLLLKFPELKCSPGPVVDCLLSAGADSGVLAVWQEFVAQPIQPPDEENEF